MLAWGTLNADLEYGMDPDLPPQQRNRQQIIKFLGGYKAGFSASDFDPLTPPLGGLSFMDFDARITGRDANPANCASCASSLADKARNPS